MNKIFLLLCSIFYLILCIFSIVTGIIYMSGKRKLNPIELSDKFISKLDTNDKLNKFTIKMGFITFIVGIVQGVTSYALFINNSKFLYYFALSFTIFSILSVIFKLKSRINSFSLIKLIFYTIILIIIVNNL